jgi:hypothetical protein
LSLSCNANNQDLTFQIFRNGSAVPTHAAQHTSTTTEVSSVTTSGVIQGVAPGDVFDIRVSNATSTGKTVTVYFGNFSLAAVAGATGLQGPQGIPGQDGEDGDPGKPGTDGTTGAAGPMGPAIFLTSDGEDGQDGPPGRQGVDGARGVDGAPGPPGQDGEAGDTEYVAPTRRPNYGFLFFMAG